MQPYLVITKQNRPRDSVKLESYLSRAVNDLQPKYTNFTEIRISIPDRVRLWIY